MAITFKSGKVTILKGYTTALGNKGACVAQIKGIVGYQAQVVNQQQFIANFGLRGIEAAGSAMTVSGNYLVVWQPKSLGPNASMILRWFSIGPDGFFEAGGNAPVDLSGETVQILVIGG